MKRLTVLGSTGSIGQNTLDIVRRHPDKFDVFALTAHQSVDILAQQIAEFKPDFAVLADPNHVKRLKDRLSKFKSTTQILAGESGLAQVASDPQCDYVMAAIVGAAGLLPTLAAAKAGKRILLANKESLVMSGQLLIEAVQQAGAELLPIDSEHNAIFQAMPCTLSGIEPNKQGVEKIILTGSGGPFLKTPFSELARVTPEQACNHPNWSMGRKISVDSATMMNKGLEVIEACYLFDTTTDRIDVVVHPQSVIHSMVQYVDGSVLAQLGNPDMRTPIAHAMAWPERIESGVKRLNFVELSKFEFFAPDLQRFPCLSMAIDAINKRGSASISLNAANEVAVAQFLAHAIRFTDIARVIEAVLARADWCQAESIDSILETDQQARVLAMDFIRNELNASVKLC